MALPPPESEQIRLLLIDDDEDYYFLTRDLLTDTGEDWFQLEWASSAEDGIQRIQTGGHDAILIDYHLGARNGLEVMQQALADGCKTPVIMLTGQGDREIDLEAMQSGAADYLVKDQIDARLLERAIRYAVRRARILRDMSRLVAILEATTDFVGTSDAKGRWTYINAAGRRMMELEESDPVMGLPMADFHATWAARLIEEQGLPTASKKGAWDGETALLSRGGREIPVSQLILTHRDETGEVAFYSTIARDISERLYAHQAETRLATAIEQVADCILITNPDGIISYVNPAFEHLSGYTRDEVIGQPTTMLESGAHNELFFREMWDTIRGGETWIGRFTNRKKDGSVYEVDATITPVRDRDGNISNYVSTQRDVTYEREMEEQVRQAQKMEAVGQLAGGVAHDFNNLLTVIGGFSTLLTASIPEDSELRMFVDEIVGASDRAAALTRQLLAFGRKQILQPEVLSLNDLITGLAQVLQRLLGEHTELRQVYDSNLCRVTADPGQMEQVLINMAINAHHAMEDGGCLTIETYNHHAREPILSPAGNLDPGRYVVLAMTDTGKGMTPEVQARVFEPFFTTKNGDKGSGLGLSTCYGIIKQTGGDIHVYSEPGHGTSFRIYFPAVYAHTGETKVEKRDPEILAGDETVLVVEDEGPLRELVSNVLQTGGYKVLKATNGLEGLSVVETYSDPIHLVVTDVVMPKMGGSEMVNKLKATGLEAKVLFVSGYTDDALQHRGILDPDIEFLPKPFSPAELSRKVRAVLDS